MAEKYKNSAEFCGVICNEPLFSHRTRNGAFYLFPIEIKRLSGTVDRINIMAAEELVDMVTLKVGSLIHINGSIRSYNNNSGVGNRLVISVFAQELSTDAAELANQVFLEGVLCKPPVFRKTPLGREICDLMLAVGRGFGRADYLPCIAWGGEALKCSQMQVGGKVSLEGRLQSRNYIKIVDGAETEKVAFEISISKLI